MRNPYETPNEVKREATSAELLTPPGYAWTAAAIVHLGCGGGAIGGFVGVCFGFLSSPTRDMLASAVIPPLSLLAMSVGIGYVQYLAVFRAHRLAAVLLGMLFGLFAVLGVVDVCQWLAGVSIGTVPTGLFDWAQLLRGLVASLMLGWIAISMLRWSRKIDVRGRIDSTAMRPNK